MRKLSIDGHGPGGLIGITLHEKAVHRWARASGLVGITLHEKAVHRWA